MTIGGVVDDDENKDMDVEMGTEEEGDESKEYNNPKQNIPSHIIQHFGPVKILFHDTYCASLLTDITKCMDKGSVQLYMRPGLPLILKHSIGENSHVKAMFAGMIEQAP